MTEIEPGISVDLANVDIVEKSDNKVIIHISGESFSWNVSYGVALQLIAINKRIQQQVP